MISGTHGTSSHSDATDTCVGFRDFRRLKYFYGQMLSAQDLQLEQDFFREKLKLHNRCLHGHGVVCGLLVDPVPTPTDCVPANEKAKEEELREALDEALSQQVQKASAEGDTAAEELDKEIERLRQQLAEFYKKHCREEPRTHIRIDCGVALDCQGHELVVRRPLVVDVLKALGREDYKRVAQGARTLYVSLCYCEQEIDPVRPVVADACGASPAFRYGKVQDAVRVQVTVEPPAHDDRCETCCEPCAAPCVPLAKLECFVAGHTLKRHHIHNEIRRPVSRYVPTAITGISWRHGHSYTEEEAKALLGTDHQQGDKLKGLKICFSRPVAVSTIRRGVMDVWVIEGGGGRSANIYHKRGKFIDLPKAGYTDHVFYRDTSGETLEPGDRVLITLRTSFILDKCCRPVDGDNVGGRVPQIAEYAERYGVAPLPDVCQIPPDGYGPWSSGNGTPGGTFESWFYIKERDRERDRDSYREHGRESGETTS